MSPLSIRIGLVFQPNILSTVDVDVDVVTLYFYIHYVVYVVCICFFASVCMFRSMLFMFCQFFEKKKIPVFSNYAVLCSVPGCSVIVQLCVCFILLLPSVLYECSTFAAPISNDFSTCTFCWTMCNRERSAIKVCMYILLCHDHLVRWTWLYKSFDAQIDNNNKT